MTRTIDLFQAVLWFLLFFLIFFSPLAIGGNAPTPFLVIQLTVLLGFFGRFFSQFRKTRTLDLNASPLNKAMLLVLGFCALQIFLPAQGIPSFGGSIYKEPSVQNFFKLLTYFQLFWWVLHLVDDQRQISTIYRFMFILAFVVSVLGILQRLSGAEKMFWLYEIRSVGVVLKGFFATFANRNHYAGFAGFIVMVLLGRFLYLNARYSLSRDKKHREEKFFLLFVLVFSSVSLFMTLSRGGSVFFTISLLVFYQWILAEKGKKHSGIIVFLLALSTALMLSWIGLDPILSRLSTVFGGTKDLSFPMRVQLWNVIPEMFLKYPLMGSGMGTFRYVFKALKPPFPSLARTWEHLHNDWFEILLDGGVIGFLIFFSIFIVFFKEALAICKNKEDIYARYNSGGALAGIFYLSLMSLYEFPIRTVTNSVYVAIISAVVIRLGQLYRETKGIPSVHRFAVKNPALRGAVYVTVTILFVINLAAIVRPYIAQRIIREAKITLEEAEIRRAIFWDPLQADYHYLLGQAIRKDAIYNSRQHNSEKVKLAIESFENAARLNPTGGHYYYSLMTLHKRFGDREKVDEYLEKTIQAEPSNPMYQSYYAINRFQQALAEAVVTDADITTVDSFKRGLKAYFRVQQISPGSSLSIYKQYFPEYDRIDQILHEKGLLPEEKKL